MKILLFVVEYIVGINNNVFVNEEERAELARLPIDGPFCLEATGARAIWGEGEVAP